jgi:leucyl/phenylalanyl-tRNA--protein transferase
MAGQRKQPKLTPELLVAAYEQGVFPMGSRRGIDWYRPDPRGILALDSFHASKSLMQTVRSGRYEVRSDADFEGVMRACADRPESSWITEEIIGVYCRLHAMGLAHSVESYRDGRLEGGLYGVHLGAAFFGESMFHRGRDASKVALVALVERMRRQGFMLLDVQFGTEHLSQFGVIEIPCAAYLKRLEEALNRQCAWTT